MAVSGTEATVAADWLECPRPTKTTPATTATNTSATAAAADTRRP